MPQAVRFCFELEGVVSACDLEVKFSFGVLILVRSLTLTEAVETGHTGANLRAFGVCCPLFIFRKNTRFLLLNNMVPKESTQHPYCCIKTIVLHSTLYKVETSKPIQDLTPAQSVKKQ